MCLTGGRLWGRVQPFIAVLCCPFRLLQSETFGISKLQTCQVSKLKTTISMRFLIGNEVGSFSLTTILFVLDLSTVA